MTLGEILGYVSAGAAVLYGVWDRYAKTRETDQTTAQKLREELVKEIERRDRDIQGMRTQRDEMDRLLDTLTFEKRYIQEFLKDIESDMFDYEWVKKRAKALLERLNHE